MCQIYLANKSFQNKPFEALGVGSESPAAAVGAGDGDGLSRLLKLSSWSIERKETPAKTPLAVSRSAAERLSHASAMPLRAALS